MKTYYSIGETAKLLGITVQTLRYYERIGLVTPKVVNERTGYRYYAFSQFHMIDRIKYLQYLGMPLDDIGQIMAKGTVDGLLPALEEQWQLAQKELAQVQARINDIEWYVNYFTYLSRMDPSTELYRIQMDTRYIISVPCYDEDELADMEIRLARVRSSKELRDLSYRRQYGYELSVAKLFQQQFRPVSYFIYIKQRPKFLTPHYKVLPAGEYLCFRTPLYQEKWDTTILNTFFAAKPRPRLVLALEFEDNLVEYKNAMYEIQLYLG